MGHNQKDPETRLERTYRVKIEEEQDTVEER